MEHILDFESPIIVALDCSTKKEAINLLTQLNPKICKIKIGLELFISLGTEIIDITHKYGFQIFLDLKLHDIPNTVYKSCKAIAKLGIWLTTIHASIGLHGLMLAKDGLSDSKTLLLAVTVLTSINEADLIEIGIHNNLKEQIFHCSKLANSANLSGVICAPDDVVMIKKDFPDLLTVTPGIKLENQIKDDQKRFATPIEAYNNGADYLVIGRAITAASAPINVLDKIYHDIKKAFFIKNK